MSERLIKEKAYRLCLSLYHRNPALLVPATISKITRTPEGGIKGGGLERERDIGEGRLEGFALVLPKKQNI
jgi:hypothetical protein